MGTASSETGTTSVALSIGARFQFCKGPCLDCDDDGVCLTYSPALVYRGATRWFRLLAGLAWAAICTQAAAQAQPAAPAAEIPATAPASPASAQQRAAAPGAPFAFTRSVPIGRPAKPAQVGVQQRPDGVWLSVDKARTALPIRSPERADVQSVTLAGGVTVAILRVSGAGQEAVALIGRDAGGRSRVAWAGALDRRGDPGERHAYLLETADRTGDGAPDLVLSETDERVRRCGEERTSFGARAIDPGSFALRRVGSSLAPAVAGTVTPPLAGAAAGTAARAPAAAATLEASAQSPGPSKPPVVPALRLQGVSSQRDAALDAHRTQALTDGDLGSVWTTAEADGRGEFATFQWLGHGRGIAALAVVPVPLGAKAGTAAAPTSLRVLDERGARYRLQLPPNTAPGQRLWAKLPEPLAGTCLTLEIESTTSASQPTALAEVEAYTDLDFGAGVETLVAELVAGGERGGKATQLLSTLGPDVVPLLAGAWPKLDPAARQRALRVLSPHVERVEGARMLAMGALDDADPAVRDAAFEVLLQGGATARQVLLPRVSGANERGDAFALALARRAPAQSMPALLDALQHPGGPDRKALRRALLIACQHGGAEALAAVRERLQRADLAVASRAALALALSRGTKGDEVHALAAEVAASTAPNAVEFADRYRLAEAARALPAGEPLDGWLAELAAKEERWMLRSLAVTALAERAASNAQNVATVALKDAYPRVRVAAASALAAHREAFADLRTHARRDQWPMVRAAALDALAGQPGAAAVLREAVTDNAHQVRAAAVRGLARSGTRDAWPLVKARLEDAEEWPEVLTEAVAYAGTLCVAAASKPLLALLRRGSQPDADANDAELAVAALDALRRLGGDAERAALSMATSPAAPPAFRGAAEHPLPKERRCVAAQGAPR